MEPAAWSEDPHCTQCARVVSARELEAGGDGPCSCPHCGGELAWPPTDPGEPRGAAPAAAVAAAHGAAATRP